MFKPTHITTIEIVGVFGERVAAPGTLLEFESTSPIDGAQWFHDEKGDKFCLAIHEVNILDRAD